MKQAALPYGTSASSFVHCSDVAAYLATVADNTFHAMLSDPPYGLSFMGKAWDKVVPPREVWRETLRVLRPGAYALVFGGTRTFHRLAVGLEDAGFEVRDCLCWLYGSGFPKNGKSALKPAWEPVLLVRKPLDGTVARNVQRWGTGALAIDPCRIEGKPRTTHARGNVRGAPNTVESWDFGNGYESPGAEGRFPANVLLDDDAARVLDAEVGPLKSGNLLPGHKQGVGNAVPIGGGGVIRKAYGGDEGGPSRFFYTAKVSKRERNAGVPCDHPTLKPVSLTTYLARLLLPPVDDACLLVPYAGAGSEMAGALRAGWPSVVGIEKEARYVAMARERIAALAEEAAE